MEYNKFNAVHPDAADRERGWIPEINPFAPVFAKPERGKFFTKHIFIMADQLFYDIDAVTGIIDRAARGQQGMPEVATSESDTFRPMFFRWFDKYVRLAEGRMQAFVLKPTGGTRMNTLKEWREREITLAMPDSWDDTCYDDLVDAIHRYVVDGALYEYFSLTLTAKDPRTIDKLTQLEDDSDAIKNYVCAVKPGAVRKRLNPF